MSQAKVNLHLADEMKILELSSPACNAKSQKKLQSERMVRWNEHTSLTEKKDYVPHTYLSFI